MTPRGQAICLGTIWIQLNNFAWVQWSPNKLTRTLSMSRIPKHPVTLSLKKKIMQEPKTQLQTLSWSWTPKINILNVGKVLDQDINTLTVNLYTKLVALFLVAGLPKSPADQVKTVSVPVPNRTLSVDDLEFKTETTGNSTFKDFMYKIVTTN